MDLSVFELRYRNDTGGAPAYDPAILLKIVLYAYACGVISSRRIAKSCRDNIVFMALAAGAQPHVTAIAHFVSSMHKEIKQVFVDVLSACEAQGLIGHEVLALDGCNGTDEDVLTYAMFPQVAPKFFAHRTEGPKNPTKSPAAAPVQSDGKAPVSSRVEYKIKIGDKSRNVVVEPA